MIWVSLKQLYKQWRCKPTVNAKHDSVIFDEIVTVGERNKGKKVNAHCKCGKDLGLR